MVAWWLLQTLPQSCLVYDGLKCIQNKLAPHNIVARSSLHYFKKISIAFFIFSPENILNDVFIITVSELIIMHFLYSQNPSLMESQLIFYEAKSEHGPWAFYIKGNRKKCYLTAGPGETIIAKPRRGGEEIYVWIMDPQTYRMVITDT